MFYINKNKYIEEVNILLKFNLEKKLDYMPKSFNKKSKKIFELFRSRLLLEKTVDECISFNKKLNWNNQVKNMYLVDNAESLIEVFKLRSIVYSEINYTDEFKDPIVGLNFDIYDQNSAILFYKNNNIITGTTRLIYDSINKLPSDKIYSFDSLRKDYSTIGELSRLIIKNEKKGLGLEFKNIMASIYYFFKSNNIDITVLGIKKEHYKMYSKFGGNEIISEISNYGKIKLPALLLSWNPEHVSSFFERCFLVKN